MTHEKQYEVTIRENGVEIDRREIDDPFIHSTVKPKGILNAVRVLFGRYIIVVHVTGTPSAYRVVFSSEYPLIKYNQKVASQCDGAMMIGRKA